MPLIQSQCTFVKLPLGVVVAVAVLAFPVDAMAIATKDKKRRQLNDTRR
jgi:hypothetical protein